MKQISAIMSNSRSRSARKRALMSGETNDEDVLRVGLLSHTLKIFGGVSNPAHTPLDSIVKRLRALRFFPHPLWV
jgi:hypothetical protein